MAGPDWPSVPYGAAPGRGARVRLGACDSLSNLRGAAAHGCGDIRTESSRWRVHGYSRAVPPAQVDGCDTRTVTVRCRPARMRVSPNPRSSLSTSTACRLTCGCTNFFDGADPSAPICRAPASASCSAASPRMPVPSKPEGSRQRSTIDSGELKLPNKAQPGRAAACQSNRQLIPTQTGNLGFFKGYRRRSPCFDSIAGMSASR